MSAIYRCTMKPIMAMEIITHQSPPMVAFGKNGSERTR